MQITDLDSFLYHVEESFRKAQLIKLTLSGKRDKHTDLKNVFVKPVKIKNEVKLNFVYRHATQDTTKNYDLEEALVLLRNLLEKSFYIANHFTTLHEIQFTITLSGKILVSKKTVEQVNEPILTHNKEKFRYISTENNVYLRELGITSAEGKVKSDKQDKYRQINKYVEIIETLISSASFSPTFTVADMGSGKGYLTFALYDYLTNTLALSPKITGIELRKELVEQCNQIAKKAEFANLSFETGTIENAQIAEVDMLIALHACDTATDDAIYKGIKSGAKIIVCAPCCHKQIRKQLAPKNDLKAITKFGILEERQAEIVTDTIRALILEANGYKTKVFEFIASEHTAKNVMITAVKANITAERKVELETEISNLKQLFGIQTHYLQQLF